MRIHLRSTLSSYSVFKDHISFGGDNRDRTGNLRLARAALSQLSYIPKKVFLVRIERVLVGLGRFELPTSRLSGARSHQTELQARLTQDLSVKITTVQTRPQAHRARKIKFL